MADKTRCDEDCCGGCENFNEIVGNNSNNDQTINEKKEDTKKKGSDKSDTN